VKASFLLVSIFRASSYSFPFSFFPIDNPTTPSRNSANLGGLQTPEAATGPNLTLFVASPATADLFRAELQSRNLQFNIPFNKGMTKAVLIQLWYMATTVASAIVMTLLALACVASVLIPTVSPGSRRYK
jgi:hypothetical protein